MRRLALLLFALGLSFTAVAQSALTIYNQRFAVVRETIPLELEAGENRVEYEAITNHVEPQSVILRDPRGERSIQILEQNYQAIPISQDLLLSLHEGKTIDFLVREGELSTIKPGKIIRAPEPSNNLENSLLAGWNQNRRAFMGAADGQQPIIEMDGTIRFGLPGQPLFPSLGDDSVLKPKLSWLLSTDTAGTFNAELSYVTGGLVWEADYNLIAPEEGDTLEAVGWVSFENRSGKTFEDATVQLMAGDVQKEQPGVQRYLFAGGMAGGGFGQPQVTEREFDEYHLYSLQRPLTLMHGELKQVEFIRSDNIASNSFYVYDGASLEDDELQGWGSGKFEQPTYGTESNNKISVYREFKNTESNQLGIPLPKGRIRLYRGDTDGALQFVGEDRIDHTPQGETVRVRTGSAFDLVGERIQTDFVHESGAVQPRLPNAQRVIRESFDIKLRNRKDTPVEIRVVEHMYRSSNWDVIHYSHPFEKIDSRTIEFRVSVVPDAEETVSYTVEYPWSR